MKKCKNFEELYLFSKFSYSLRQFRRSLYNDGFISKSKIENPSKKYVDRIWKETLASIFFFLFFRSFFFFNQNLVDIYLYAVLENFYRSSCY